ncbi:hypothetical protein [Halobaculum litoreum]|uniref:Uncharacterized protein n=1 Tax=Halobaculum litoreum TaxID=3031998 RepID=A0ABD5XMB7_9EURY|nr:hypothetical protein [Halobaculum sp. DT92]
MSVGTPARRLRYPLALVAVVAGLLLLEYLLEVTLTGYAATGTTWLPTVGTIGQTMVAYTLPVSLLATFGVPVVAFVFGVRYARAA